MSPRRSNASTERGADYLPWAVDADQIPEDVRTVVLGSRETAERGRALGAVVFTDITDSTSRIAELGDRNWRDLLEAHNALVRRELVRYGGREVDTAGDGFVATFAGPSDAIACAAASIEAVGWIGLDIRAGVHAGEFELVDRKPSGLAMSIGARVAGLATRREVWVSDVVRQLLLGSEMRFEERGTHELKGVPGRWPLYAAAS